MVGVDQSAEWELVGETEIFGENILSATSFATNPTWPDLGPNPGDRGGKPATNHLRYGTASRIVLIYAQRKLCLYSYIGFSCLNIAT
jgi:hypothetical protein